MNYIAFDLETTSLDSFSGCVVEFGAVRFSEDGSVIDTYQQLVKPRSIMHEGARAANGISDEMLVDAPPISKVLPEFLDYLCLAGTAQTQNLIAHNAIFDVRFLRSEINFAALNGISIPTSELKAFLVWDTMQIAKKHHAFRGSNGRISLRKLRDKFGIESNGVHRSLADSLACKEAFIRMSGHSAKIYTVPERIIQ